MLCDSKQFNASSTFILCLQSSKKEKEDTSTAICIKKANQSSAPGINISLSVQNRNVVCSWYSMAEEGFW